MESSVLERVTPEQMHTRIRCEQSRRDILEFAQYVNPSYQVGFPHLEIAEKLRRIESGDLRRLMVMMPPRHGKSLLISQIFPCWMLGRHPLLEIVQSGYAAPITLEHSRKARDIFIHKECRNVFPGATHVPGREAQKQIRPERQAAHEWGTVQGGRYLAVGVDGGLTGRGADIAIIDDPVKNRKDAESSTVRQGVYDWYKSTLYTRLSPKGVIILVMTRWHPEDLAGVLLEEAKQEGEKWEVIKFPAINENGEPLWPERWGLEALERIRRALGTFEWDALYQQEPAVRGGNLFSNVDQIWVHESEKDFPNIEYARGWDLASSEKERTSSDPDYTVGVKAGVAHKAEKIPELWVKDCVYGRWEAPKRNQVILTTAIQDGKDVRVGVEVVAGYKDAYTTVKKALKGVRAVKKITVAKDKVVNSACLEPMFEARTVHILKAPWNDFWLRHFMEFPKGAHDDAVDGTLVAYNTLQFTQTNVDQYSQIRQMLGV